MKINIVFSQAVSKSRRNHSETYEIESDTLTSCSDPAEKIKVHERAKIQYYPWGFIFKGRHIEKNIRGEFAVPWLAIMKITQVKE